MNWYLGLAIWGGALISMIVQLSGRGGRFLGLDVV